MSESCCCCSSGGCSVAPVIQTVSTRLTWGDRFGGLKVRFGVGRMNYRVEPGLYAVGTPDKSAPVLVSANYKLTFDTVRKELTEVSCWLLILDTKGVNVWCAAGKGTFGTDELIDRLNETGLSETVSHKTLILPQLGASGINAIEVRRQTGFSVVYGTVRAKDIKAFLLAGNMATEEMRTVKFTLPDRLVLTPVEVAAAARKSLLLFGALFLLNLFLPEPFGLADFIACAGAILVGTLITPVLLPFIPGRAFSFKGGLLGLIWAAVFVWLNTWDWFTSIGYMLALPSVSAYLAMQFTGSSTYTSPSGVLKEMRIALPFIIGAVAVGVALLLLGRIL
jgi:hypothetical protein